jgi:hypothetical protein
MTSIFDLKTNVDELSSTNEGTSRMEYDQHPPTRDVVNSNFANGAIHFRFQTSGQKWWIPSRSYIRTRFQLTKGDGTPVDTAFGVAPNMGLMSNLFQSAEMRINDKVVSRVADFMPQVDAIETRLTKSKSWLESIGQATNWWNESQSIRLQEVSNNGTLVKSKLAGDQTVATGRAGLGFDAAGGNNNNASYDAATGIITFTIGTSASPLPPDVRVAFPAGSFFRYTGGTNNPTSSGVLMKVITGQNGAPAGSATTIVVEPVVGADENGNTGQGDFERVVITPANASDSRRIGEFELTWCPPLSLFKIGHALPSGRYELVLNPQTSTSYQRRAIESILGAPSKEPQLPGQANDPAKFKLNVVNMYLYCATVDGPRADDITYLLDLEQTRCQSEKVDTADFQQKNFDVSPSTYALSVAYQDLRAGENTAISASKFKSYEAGLTPTVEQELKLDRFFINYAGQNLPAPDADPAFVAGTDYTTQRYAETNIYSGAYFDTGGAETIDEWHERGAYYYFSWPRDGTDRSTRVNVHQKFNGADVSNLRCLLFDHSKQVARVRVQDGRVVDVQVEDA